MKQNTLPADVASTVSRALNEDLGPGDLTARLVASDVLCNATVVCREAAVLCGGAWFTEVFRQLDDNIRVAWHYEDGEGIQAGQTVCSLSGPTRAILSGERTALNFLQLLSGTATITRDHVAMIKHTKTQLLDTRKTVPGLRSAQKYAVLCGGGKNHRMGLYDAILLKENHIRASGSITAAVSQAKSLQRHIEIEVENEAELEEAIEAGAGTVLLDNFTLEQIKRAVRLNQGRVRLEVSGGVEKSDLPALAATGIDFISVGALTKDVRAIDFSMLLAERS